MKGRLASPPRGGTYPAAGEAGVRERQLTESRERPVSALCGELVEPREFTLYPVPIVARVDGEADAQGYRPRVVGVGAS